MNTYLQSLYESYKRQRDKLHDAALEAGARYDRTVLTLAGGALVLSITFIEKIAPSPEVWTIPILVIAWLSLLFSTVMQLLALASSQKAVQLQIDRLDAEYGFYLAADDVAQAVRHKPPDSDNQHVSEVKCYNVLSRWALIIGIISLFVFSGVNTYLRKENQMSDDKSERKERVTIKNRDSQAINESIRGTYIPPKNELPPPPPPKDQNGEKKN